MPYPETLKRPPDKSCVCFKGHGEGLPKHKESTRRSIEVLSFFLRLFFKNFFPFVSALPSSLLLSLSIKLRATARTISGRGVEREKKKRKEEEEEKWVRATYFFFPQFTEAEGGGVIVG